LFSVSIEPFNNEAILYRVDQVLVEMRGPQCHILKQNFLGAASGQQLTSVHHYDVDQFILYQYLQNTARCAGCFAGRNGQNCFWVQAVDLFIGWGTAIFHFDLNNCRVAPLASCGRYYKLRCTCIGNQKNKRSSVPWFSW